jgi:hypothetical protein
VLGFALSVFVAACGSEDDESASSTTTTSATTTQSTTTALTTTEETPTTTEDGGVTTPPITGPASNGQTIRISVVGGRPQGGIQRPSVKQGEHVTLVVTSDVADEIHLHGYDISADAAPGSPARLTFDAKIPGRFEIELEDRGVQIAELTVEP